MGTSKSQSLGGGLGPGCCVPQTSSSVKAQQDEADPSDPVSQYPLHPTEVEHVGSFWVAGPSSSQERLASRSQMALSSPLTSLEGRLDFLGARFAAQRQESPVPGRGK